MKKLLNSFLSGCATMACLMTLGCGELRPDGFPDLYPVTLVVTQDGEPLADAMVSLYPENSSLTRWPVGGMSDASGNVELVTYGKYEGVPAGIFKVMVNKTVHEGDPIPESPAADASPAERAAYDRAIKTGSRESFQVVQKEFRTADKTSLTVTVSPDAENSYTLDVGAAVKEKDQQASAVGGGSADYVPMGESAVAE
ncbi:hypothetical protein FF011L_40020 [Roseimaritima multifibrata]|uniref:Carboxypeptidase regulatory-like domain-containing protein n=1 Tax=Roseimaritima multifibrata TaxID=1930274 RepID=A0A517MJY9_9BACT|nr:hypothetical protein [Roseimaritima multifibrata]QDS95209.1 hypothetical protein FF011L_40020 [Roseimaritima multifibrata]